MIVYLDLPSLLDLAELILGAPPLVRDMGLLSSAAARPATVAFGVEAYEDIWTKAGALLQSIALNHALIDGNKRLAWVAARVFLDLNGVPSPQLALIIWRVPGADQGSAELTLRRPAGVPVTLARPDHAGRIFPSDR